MDQKQPRLESILEQAVEIENPTDRQAFITNACGEDSLLKDQVEQMVANHFLAGSFLENPATFLAAPPQTELGPKPGTQIGPYKLLEQIGEGGMGLVFVAEQLQPIRRQVALKLIKPGMDSKQVIARFLAERQALALMDHPNIAKVLDAGTTETGQPFFVMELIRGIPITEFCDKAQFPIKRRLDLFIQICRAVQHAHTKGVIHRDLKPSNILVTSHDGFPVPMVIDFGIAKALGTRLTDQTLYSAFAQMIGTPVYMSPEQAEFNQIGVDTRSDIYSLGVLLYELLTGETPFDKKRMKSAALDEFRRILREEEPPRPSAKLTTIGKRLSTASERRSVDGRKLTQLLQGELDWIVLKSLEKDRNRRYETASSFAEDVQRYLDDKPVEACPPSAGYQLKKYLRKNRRILVTVGIIATALLGATVFSTWQAFNAHRAAIAEINQRLKKEMNLKLAMETLDQVYMQIAEDRLPRKKTLDPFDLEFLQKALVLYEKIIKENDNSPDSLFEKSKALIRVGQLRKKLGINLDDEPGVYRESLQILGQLVSDFPVKPEYMSALAAGNATLGDALTQRGDYKEGEICYRQAISLWSVLSSEDQEKTEYKEKLAELKMGMAILLEKNENPREAERFARASFEGYEKLAREFPLEPKYQRGMAQYLANKAITLEGDGNIAEAAKTTAQAIKIYEKLSKESKRDSRNLEPLALCLVNLSHFSPDDKIEKKEEFIRQAIGYWKQLVEEFPQDHGFLFKLADSDVQLAIILQMMNREAEAQETYDFAIKAMEQAIAKAPDELDYQIKFGAALSNQAILFRDLGRFKEAEILLKRAIEYQSSAHRKDPKNLTCRRFLSTHYSMLGTTLEKNRKYSEAAEAFRSAFKIDPTNYDPLHFLSWLLLNCPDEKVRNPAKALEAAIKATEGNPLDGAYWGTRGVAYYKLVDFPKAIHSLNQSMAHGGKNSAWVGFYLSLSHFHNGNPKEGRIWFDRTKPLLEKNPDDEDLWRPAYAESVKTFQIPEKDQKPNRSSLIFDKERSLTLITADEKIKNAQTRLDLSSKNNGPIALETQEAMAQLALAHDSAGHWLRASQIMKELVSIQETSLEKSNPQIRVSQNRLADFYRKGGLWKDGDAAYKKLVKVSVTQCGPNDRETLQYQSNYTNFLTASGNYTEAIQLAEEIAEKQKQWESDRFNTLQTLGWAYYWIGRHLDSERLTRDMIIRIKNEKKQPSIFEMTTFSVLGMNLLARKQFSEAEGVFREALSIADKAKPPEWQRYRIMNLLGAALFRQGNRTNAEAFLVEGFEGMAKYRSLIPAPWNRHIHFACNEVVQYYETTGSLEKLKIWKEKLALLESPGQ